MKKTKYTRIKWILIAVFTCCLLLTGAAYPAKAHEVLNELVRLLGNADESARWRASYACASHGANLQSSLSEIFATQAREAQLLTRGHALPAFDSSSLMNDSRPVLDADGKRTEFAAETCTSLLGNLNRWAEAQSEKYTSRLVSTDIPASEARLIEIKEAYREDDADDLGRRIYALHYVVESVTDKAKLVRADGDILLLSFADNS